MYAIRSCSMFSSFSSAATMASSFFFPSSTFRSSF
nr:MAG TPA: hypothetical protein [Caudoviricetes sp.]